MITARADYEQQRMAMELAENNQEFLNKGRQPSRQQCQRQRRRLRVPLMRDFDSPSLKN